MILIKKELDNGKFKFPEPFDNGMRMKDMLEDEVQDSFYINNDKSKQLLNELEESGKLEKEFSNAVRGGARELRPPSVGYSKELIPGIFRDRCSKLQSFSEAANTLLARDYKGFGNQGMNGVIERESK